MSESRSPYVVVGASLAGAKAVQGLREVGYDGPVVLVGEEPELPYERPELSKGFLRGEKPFEELLVHEQSWYSEHDVDLRLGVAATSVSPAEHTVTLADGSSINYGRLLLATGSAVRTLPVPGRDLAGIHYLRTVDDAKALAGALSGGARLVVVGAGWIGLEAAAVARQRGCEVVMIEPAPAPLLRALGPEMGAHFADLHRRQGVDVRLGTGVEGFRGEAGRVTGVVSGGREEPADVVVVGVGVRPRTELAEAAGLTVQDGVVVDEMLRSSNPDVFAAGDMARARNMLYDDHLRVEHWANALDQGLAAGRSMGGAGRPWDATPFFYSDQYDLGMEYRGTTLFGYDRVVVRGDPASDYLAFWLHEGRLVAGMNVNRWDDGEAIETLVRARAQVDADKLADDAVPVASLADAAGVST